jgi:hypothetical protein
MMGLAILGWWVVALTALWVSWRVGALPPQVGSPTLPGLTVVVPACNEVDTLEAALTSLLAVEYAGDLQIILVNDRSSDGTGDLMESLAQRYPQLEVQHIERLPPGWLGKNWALHQGAAKARGEWLLFTDADVHFSQDALTRAVQAALQRPLDHLVMTPEVDCATFWEKVFISYFTTAFVFRFRPDKAEDEGPYYVGVGAFNLVRRQVYTQLGGHSSLSHQVLDDMELGRLFKSRGFRQRVFGAVGCVRVRWAVGLRGLIQGLEKNAYAGMQYSRIETLIAVLGTLYVSLAPLQAGPLGILLALGAWLTCSWCHSRSSGSPWWAGFFYPLAGVIFAFILARSALLCEWRGGIHWRGTFYPLKDLT